jgi:hypothetical protein
MDHRWDESIRGEHEARIERERFEGATERPVAEREERVRRASVRRAPMSPWEIGRAHYDQRDLYTKSSRIDDDGYGVGPRFHPEEGSYAYPRPPGEAEPEHAPRDLYEREAWPWRNYDLDEARRARAASGHEREHEHEHEHEHEEEGFWERISDKIVTALVGDPPEAQIFERGPKDWRRPDARVHDDVCVALSNHPEIDASDIEVTVKDAEVTLTGTVPERRMKRLAEDVTLACAGVRDVHNRLEVQKDDGSFLSPMLATFAT